MLLVHIGEQESNALLKEINKQRQMRPLTHDVMRNLLKEINFRVTKIRITDIVANTYYARIHLAHLNSGQVEPDTEVDVDARPSDAINLAVRFGAPMFVNKRIADAASTSISQEPPVQNESSAEIVRSVRETLASFEDPTSELPRGRQRTCTSAMASARPASLALTAGDAVGTLALHVARPSSVGGECMLVRLTRSAAGGYVCVRACACVGGGGCPVAKALSRNLPRHALAH